MRPGVMLLDFGGPTGPEALQPFLSRLLSDVLPGPGWLKGVVAPWIASRRAVRVAPSYAEIGWSPLVPTHHAQAAALRAELGDEAPPMASGMMFTPPEMSDGLRHLLDQGVDTLIALPFFPHYSLATTGSAFTLLWQAMVAEGATDLGLHLMPAYYDHPRYLAALAASIQTGVAKTAGEGPLHLVFSPHGLPVSWVTKRGDPYPYHVRESIRRVLRLLDWQGPVHVGWQSRLGPVRWLGPSTVETIERLGSQGVQRVLVVPIAFVSENIETLDELDIQLGRVAHDVGIQHFGRAPTLGLSSDFIGCLAELVRGTLQDMAYRCVRCGLPKSDAHRRRHGCHNCNFNHPPFLRDSRAAQ